MPWCSAPLSSGLDRVWPLSLGQGLATLALLALAPEQTQLKIAHLRLRQLQCRPQLRFTLSSLRLVPQQLPPVMLSLPLHALDRPAVLALPVLGLAPQADVLLLRQPHVLRREWHRPRRIPRRFDLHDPGRRIHAAPP